MCSLAHRVGGHRSAFPNYQTTQVRSNISLAQLLNCLDGLATEDGLVVVATANDPVALDPAILKRPGRFDRVVAFPNPNPALRTKYLRKLNPNIGLEDLNGAVADCDGFSFAQLREAYILAPARLRKGSRCHAGEPPGCGTDPARGFHYDQHTQEFRGVRHGQLLAKSCAAHSCESVAGNRICAHPDARGR